MKHFVIIPIFGKLLHILAIFFHVPIHYKAKTKFYRSVCKSVSVYTHAQKKRPTASKFGTEILQKGIYYTSKRLFKNRSRFFRMIKKIFSWILVQIIHLFQDFSYSCVVLEVYSS